MKNNRKIILQVLTISALTLNQLSAKVCTKSDLAYGFSECDRLTQTRTGKYLIMPFHLI